MGLSVYSRVWFYRIAIACALDLPLGGGGRGEAAGVGNWTQAAERSPAPTLHVDPSPQGEG